MSKQTSKQTSKQNNLRIAFIGGGNMAGALARGLAGHLYDASAIHIIDINADICAAWRQAGMSVSDGPDERLAQCQVWVYAVKPQGMRETALATRAWLREDTLVISIAAGIRADSLAQWLGEPGQPWTRVVRCMPNTPALVGAGVSGLAALPDVNEADRTLATRILTSVGEVVWVNDDAALDAVTALSGSGPAYVFRFLEGLIQGGQAVGLSAKQARQLALATLAGATKLAAQSEDPPAVLRERVTSKGGTTAAALAVFDQEDLVGMTGRAIQAAASRAVALSDEFGG